MAVYGTWVKNLIEPMFTDMPLKAMLVTGTANVNHDYRSDITTELVTSGYPSGGVSVGLASVTTDLTDAVVTIWPENWSLYFGAIDISTVTGIVFYESTGTAATDRLIYADMFGLVEVDGVMDYYYTPSDDGLIAVTFDDEAGA